MAIYSLFLQHIIYSLKPNGKAAVVVPTGFITAKSGVERNVLKYIVDEKIIYGCINMPSNVFATTGTNVSVLFFDKSKQNDKVVLIDASKHYVKTGEFVNIKIIEATEFDLYGEPA